MSLLFLTNLSKKIQDKKNNESSGQKDNTRYLNLNQIKNIRKYLLEKSAIKGDESNFNFILKNKKLILDYFNPGDTPGIPRHKKGGLEGGTPSLKNINSKKQAINALFTYLQYFKDQDEYKDFYNVIFKLKEDIKESVINISLSQVQSDKEKLKWKTGEDYEIIRDKLDELSEKYKNYNMNDHNDVMNEDYINFVICSLYVYQAPRRSLDYVMKMVDNEKDATDPNINYFVIPKYLFIFRNFKTVKSFKGEQKYDIEDPSLRDIIDQYMKNNITDYFLIDEKKQPINSKQISYRVRKFLLKLIGKKASINTLRHLYIEDFYSRFKSMPSAKDIKDLSDKMAHSLLTNLTYDKSKSKSKKLSQEVINRLIPIQINNLEEEIKDEVKPIVENKKINEEWNKILHDFYYKDSGNFYGQNKFEKLISVEYNAKNPKKIIPRNYIRNWIKQQEIYSLTFPKKKTTGIRSLISTAPYKILAIDLQVYPNITKENKGYANLFVAIDMHTKYAYTAKMKNKTPQDTIQSYKEIMNDPFKKYSLVISDNGGEFQGLFDQFLKEQGSKHLFLEPGTPWQNHAERFNRSFKLHLKRLWLYNNNNNWIDHYKNITDSYNKSYHSTIEMTPIEAFKSENTETVLNNIRKKGIKFEKDAQKLKIGDHVRVILKKDLFDKSALNWSKEIYKISSVIRSRLNNPERYKLEDLKGNSIQGGEFNINKLQLLPPGRYVKIKIKKTNPPRFNIIDDDEIAHEDVPKKKTIKIKIKKYLKPVNIELKLKKSDKELETTSKTLKQKLAPQIHKRVSKPNPKYS